LPAACWPKVAGAAIQHCVSMARARISGSQWSFPVCTVKADGRKISSAPARRSARNSSETGHHSRWAAHLHAVDLAGDNLVAGAEHGAFAITVPVGSDVVEQMDLSIAAISWPVGLNTKVVL